MKKIILRIKDIINFKHKETYQEIKDIIVNKNIIHDGLLISIDSGVGYVWREENNENLIKIIA